MKAFNDMDSCQLKSIIAKYRWLYQLGLQGPDIFFYHIPFIFHRDNRNVGSFMHDHYANAFFANSLNTMTEIPSRQQREEALSYIAGFMCHYVCDSTCHPFVYGRIHYNPTARSSKYFGKHAALENDIDNLLLWKYKGKKPSEFSQSATISLNGFELQFISDFLSRVINETYYPISERNNFRMTPGKVTMSIFAQRFGNRALADPSGRKKKHLGKVEGFFVKNPFVTEKMITDARPDPVPVLNLDHEVWTNPWDRRLASDESFPDLFNRALTKCHSLFFLLNEEITDPDLLTEKDFHRILNELGNYSYHSGLTSD